MIANRSGELEDALQAHQARFLLDLVADQTGNGATVKAMLAIVGFRMGDDQFRTLVGRLEADGLVSSKTVEGKSHRALVLSLTRDGAEVQSGDVTRHWIAPHQMLD